MERRGEANSFEHLYVDAKRVLFIACEPVILAQIRTEQQTVFP